jgi:hypothetical protein
MPVTLYDMISSGFSELIISMQFLNKRIASGSLAFISATYFLFIKTGKTYILNK